jgi:predicted dehydrogenase
VLDRKDIDAVTIGTPDHWHAIMTAMACQAGKDVYSEKPMCRTIQEGQAMINAARQYKRVVQIGAQGRSNPNAWAACQFVRNGNLGRVKHVEFWHELNWEKEPGFDWPVDSEAPPELDWEMWLGPARWMPYNPLRCHFNFRWLMDIAGGFIRDRGQHGLSIVFWCMGADGTGPVSVEATGEPAKEGIWDTPVTMNVKWEFKNPDWTLTWEQPGARHPFPHDPQQKEIPWGAKYHGDRDTLIVSGGDGGCDTEPRAKDYTPPPAGFVPYKMDNPIVGNDATSKHRENWYRCIKSREQCISSPELMFKVITVPILGNIAYQLGRKLEWDAKKEQFVNDAEANRMLAQPYRAPWHL